MSDPSLSWSTAIASSCTSIASVPAVTVPVPSAVTSIAPLFQIPAIKFKRRSIAANKENQSAASASHRASLSLSPVTKQSRDGRLSITTTAPLTPASNTTTANITSPLRTSIASSSSSPIKSLLLSSPEKRSRHSTTASLTSPTNHSENIRVVVRIRAIAPSSSPDSCVTVSAANTVHICRDREGDLREYSAAFDHVYGPEADTGVIFNESSASLIQALVAGYNASILAYGQTSSGKTYTMMGNVTETAGRQQLHGIIPRCMDLLFASIANETELFNLQQREAMEEDQQQQQTTATSSPPSSPPPLPLPPPSTVSYAVAISFFECYNERVYDLLSPLTLRHPLDVRENAEHGVHIPELQRKIITTAKDAVDWIERGNENRRVAATAHNVVSSRSHAVIQVVVEKKVMGAAGGGGVVLSRLDLVDLAGSERYDSRTHGADSRDGKQAVHEMSAINKSLNNLALVVTALTSQSRHVPYRNSVLTHLLKDSLGGTAKCQLIACVNPSSQCAYESMNTLKYASRAKMIKNGVRKAEARGECDGGDSGVMRGLHAEIERLRREKVVEKKKRRFFISSMTGVLQRMAEVCEEEDGTEVQIDDDSEDGQDHDNALLEEVEEEEEQEHAGTDQAELHTAAETSIIEEKIIPCHPSSLSLSSQRSSSERLSVRFQDEMETTTNLTLNGTLNATLDTSALNISTAGSRSRRYQFSDLFSTPHQRKSKRRYRFSVCETLQAQADTSSSSSSSLSSCPIDLPCIPSTPSSSSHLFSPATEKLLQDFDAGMGRLYAVVRRKERRDVLRCESVMEVVKGNVAEREAVRREYEMEMERKGKEMEQMRQRVQQLMQEGAGKEEELERLKSEVAGKERDMERMKADYEQTVRDREEIIQQRDAAIASLQQQTAEMEHNRLQLLERITALEDDITQRDDEKRQLEVRIRLLTEESLRKEDELVRAMARYEERRLADEIAIAQQRALTEETQRRIAGVTAEAAAIRQQLQKLETTQRDTQQHSSTITQQLHDKAAQVQALERLVTDHRAQFAVLEESARTASLQHAENVRQERGKGEALVGELREEHEMVVSSMQAEYEQCKRQSDASIKQQAAIILHVTSRIDALTAQTSQLQQQLTHAQHQKDQSDAGLIDKQEQIVALQETVCRLSAEHTTVIAQHDQEVNRLLQDATNARVKAEQDQEVLLSRLMSDYETERKAAEELSLHLAMEVRELQSRVVELTAEIARLSEKLAASEWKEGVKEEEMSDLSRLVQEKTVQITTLTQRIAQQQQELQTSKDDITALTEQHQLDLQQHQQVIRETESQHEHTLAQLKADHHQQQDVLITSHHAQQQQLELTIAALTRQGDQDALSHQSAVASLTANLEKKMSELSSLQQQLISSQRHSSGLLQSLTALKQSHQSSLSHSEAELSRLSALNRKLEAEREQNRADGEEKTLRLSALEVENARVQDALRRLKGLYERSLRAATEKQREYRDIAARVNELQTDLARVQEITIQCRDDVTVKENIIAEKEDMIDLLQQQMHHTEYNRQELSGQIHDIKLDLTASEEERAAVEARLQELRERKEERETEMCRVVAESDARIIALSSESAQLRQQLAQSEQSQAQNASDWSQQLSEKGEQVRHLQHGADAQKQLLASLEVEMMELKSMQRETQQRASEERAEMEALTQQLQAQKADNANKLQLIAELEAEKTTLQDTSRRLRSLYERQIRQELQRCKTAPANAAHHAELLIAKEQQVLALQSCVDQLTSQLSSARLQHEEEREMARAKEAGLVSVLELKVQRREEELTMLDGLFDCVVEEREREKADKLTAQAQLSQHQTMLYQSIGQAKQLQQAMKELEARADEAKEAGIGLEKEVDYWKTVSEERQRKKQELMSEYRNQQIKAEEGEQRDQQREEQQRREWEQLSGDMRRELDQRDDRIIEMNQEVTELNTRITSLTHQLNTALAAIAHDDAIITSHTASISSLQSTAAASASHVLVLEEIIDVQSAVLSEKDAALLSIENRLRCEAEDAAAMCRRESRLSGSLSWAALQVSSLANSFSALEQKLQVKEAEIGMKEEETLILSSQVQILQAENTTLAANIHQLRADNDAMTALLSDMQRQLCAIQQTREAELAEQDRLHAMIDSEKAQLQCEMERLEQEIKAYTAERSAEDAEARSTKRRIADLTATMEHQDEMLKAKEDAVRKAREECERRVREAEEKADGEVRLFQLALMEKATTINSQSLEIVRLKDNIAALSASITTLDSEINTTPPSPPVLSPSSSLSAQQQTEADGDDHVTHWVSSPHRRSLSFGRVIAELKGKQAALRALEATQAEEEMTARMREKDAELDALKASKRHTVMRMSLEIDRLRQQLHAEEEMEDKKKQSDAVDEDEDEEGVLALERLLNQTRVPFRPAHPFPSLAIIQQTQHAHARHSPMPTVTLQPDAPPRLFSPATRRPSPSHRPAADSAAHVVSLSPLQPLSVRLKRKRLSVDFEGMIAEGEKKEEDIRLSAYQLEGEKEDAERVIVPEQTVKVEKAPEAVSIGSRCVVM